MRFVVGFRHDHGATFLDDALPRVHEVNQILHVIAGQPILQDQTLQAFREVQKHDVVVASRDHRLLIIIRTN